MRDSFPRRRRSTAGYRLEAVVALVLIAAGASSIRPSAQSESPTEFGVSISRNIMVPMRDGVRLATDVYMPARAGQPLSGKWPTIVQRIAYGKDGAGTRTAEAMAKRGYVVVFQDIRGRFESEGSFYPYVNEGPDGYDLVGWIVQQPWSDGRVAAFGGSYTAGTAHALAISNPKGLAALFISMGTSNYHEDGAWQGGASELVHNLGWAAAHARAHREARDNPRVRGVLEGVFRNYVDWLRAPAASHLIPLSVVPEFAAFYRDWLERADYDEYWKRNGHNTEEHFESFPQIPVYYYGGWYDRFLRGTLKNYVGLSRSPRRFARLIVGPWTHGGGGEDAFAQEVDFGPEGDRVNTMALQVRWFDHWLKGKDTGITKELPVKIFVMGGGDGRRTPEGRLRHGGRWRSESQWPPATVRYTDYFLQPDGGLRPAKPPTAPPSGYGFDPASPVPTIGGNMTHGRSVAPMGPIDQRCRREYPLCTNELPLAARGDVLVFQTDPLAEPVEVTGPITVRLWASSSAVDTDFTAKLVDVYPPSEDYPEGFAMNLADGIIRARYRVSRERAELLSPGRLYEFEIDLWATSNLFARGHRIRLDISSSNFPRFDVNPNTGERINFHTHRVSVVNRVYHDPEHPSRVILPVVPAPVSSEGQGRYREGDPK
jgi:uncharacterized protein